MALQLAMYYIPSHASAHYFLIRHGGVIIVWRSWSLQVPSIYYKSQLHQTSVIEPTLTGLQRYWFPRLTTGRSRVTSTVIYCLVRSFVYLAYNSSINSLYISHVARHKKRKNFWITFICEISTAKIQILCLTVKCTCRKKIWVYNIMWDNWWMAKHN